MRQLARGNDEEGALLIRVAETSVRLATLHAVGRAGVRWNAVVDEEDLVWGQAWAVKSAQSMVEGAGLYMADSDTQALSKALKRVMYSKGEVSRREIYRGLKHNWKVKEVNEGLISLEIADQIHVDVRPSKPKGKGGPLVRFYTWIGK
jgi:uncharacterized protein YdiU (UPF0061 family)